MYILNPDLTYIFVATNSQNQSPQAIMKFCIMTFRHSFKWS